MSRQNLDDNNATRTRLTSGRLDTTRKVLHSSLVLGEDGPFSYFLDPNGSDRNVTLPGFKRDLALTITHCGTANGLVVKDSGGTTLTTLEQQQTILFVCSGSEWAALGQTYGFAGAGHKPGVAPDPGATVHADNDRLFLSEEGWVVITEISGDDFFKLFTDGTTTLTPTLADTLRFRSSDSTITIVATANEVTFGDNFNLSVNEPAVDHDLLLNFVADEHVAHSGVSVVAGVALTGGGTIASSRTLDWDPTEPASATPALGDTHAFFSLANNAVRRATLTAINAVLDHDALLGFVANEHIDHSTVSVTAGAGLSGGGTIAATRTISLDITGQDSQTPATADELIYYDVSAGDFDKMSFLLMNQTLDHDTLTGFVANEHIDHSTVSITGNNGLSGGGAITASQTIGIANDGVTFARMQNISTDRLIGRDTAASGDPEEISLNATLEFTGSSSIQRAALTGDVTAAAGSNSVVVNQASSAFAFTGVLAPSQITSDQNNYNPTNLSTAAVLRLSSDALRNITGLQGGASGRTLFVHNVGSNNIVLKDESASSTAANRFALTADLTLSADSVAILQYDSTSSRWRAVSGGGGGSSFDINAQSAETAIAVGDYVAIYDVSEGANNKILLDDFFEGINTLTEDTNPDEAADFVLSYDTSAGTVKKVKPNNFQIVVAGSGITVSGNTASINTNNAVGVGSYALLANKTGSSVSQGGTAAGSNLEYAGGDSSSTWNSSSASTGTWRLINGRGTSGACPNTEHGLWIRTA